MLPFILASLRGLAGPECRVADESRVGTVPAGITRARTAWVGWFCAQFGALRVVCFEFRDGKCFRCAAVDPGVDWFGVEVQVDGVGHECEDDTSEYLAATMFLTTAMDRLIVEWCVMGEVIFVHLVKMGQRGGRGLW